MSVMQTEVHDFAIEGDSATVVFTPPSDTWMIEVLAVDVTTASSGKLGVRVGGLSTTTYPRTYHQQSADNVDTLDRMHFQSVDLTAARNAKMRIWGLQLVGPTCYIGEGMLGSASNNCSRGIQTGITAHTTFEIFVTAGGDMTGGVIYVMYHVRPNSVLYSQALSLANHDFTVLDGAQSLIICSPNAVIPSGRVIEFQVSTDGGTSWNNSAGNYDRAKNNWAGGNPICGTIDHLWDAEAAGGTQPFLVSIEGLLSVSKTTAVGGGTLKQADADPYHTAGFRKASSAVDAIRMSLDGVALFTSGTAYVYGAP
jgi:hypothetical protein